MNLVKAGLRKWYDRYEATEYLSGKVGSPIESETVIVAAIRPKGVRLFLHVPPHTEDKRGVFLDEGLWDLVTERTDQGRPARQYLSWLINEQTSLKGPHWGVYKKGRRQVVAASTNPPGRFQS